jgi:DNA-binding XRE family transcriptional regulator
MPKVKNMSFEHGNAVAGRIVCFVLVALVSFILAACRLLRLAVIKTSVVLNWRCDWAVHGDAHVRLCIDAGEMTQKDLAVTRQTIMAIENGTYFPSQELAFLIADHCQKPRDEVFQLTPKDAA